MDAYTIIVTAEQRAMLTRALEVYARMFVGQTVAEQETAKKLLRELVKTRSSTVNLTQAAAL